MIEAEKSGAGHLLLDFQDVRFYVPAALTFLLGTVSRWKACGRKVEFSHLDSCPCLSYLQRMDFLALSDLPLPEEFRRHDSSGRFVPLCRVDASLRGRVDKVCSELAGCVFPDLTASDDPETAGPFDMLQYAASELINNVIQHAKGTGFVAAQVYPKSGFIRLAVADVGMGIRGSFEETQPEFWDPKMSHLDAIRTALQPKVSSKTHLPVAWGEPINAGVGLSMLKEVARHADGLFTLISGDGFYQHNHHEKRSLPSELTLPQTCPGTLCALQISKQKLGNLQQILQDAKKGIGLIQPEHRFDNLFK
ncbi:MAG: ATP-binding protein [Bryobacteraceae bacterium]|nr:ATP-binding protein [Bryobacteraceae bacterium]